MTPPAPPERTFPARCPDCQRLLADTGKPHCDWMRCQCGAHINPSGTWTNGFRRAVAP